MSNRRNIIALIALGAFARLPAQAAAITGFTEAAFKKAQEEGKSILVEIHADWCPTCRAQDPIITGLLGTPKFKELVTFRVDFDGQVDIVRAMGAQQQSTLITFKGEQEMGRSVGVTNPAKLEALLATAI
jgi:thioredoxin 1